MQAVEWDGTTKTNGQIRSAWDGRWKKKKLTSGRKAAGPINWWEKKNQPDIDRKLDRGQKGKRWSA